MARAETEYSDEDSEYLKVTSFFIEPVAQALEWLVFRPVHFVHHLINPSDPWDPENRLYGTGRRSACVGLRPRRECGLKD